MELIHNNLEALAELIASEVRAKIIAELSPGRWLTMEEAMEYAKVHSVNTIKKWVTNGYIYGFKRSGHWIIDRNSIDEWYSSEQVRI